MIRVKICGITTVSDAVAAQNLGADAIGLVFAKSPRRVSLATAKKISRALGPWVSVVGVFVDESPAMIRRLIGECRLSAVQLHGPYTPAQVRDFKGVKVIKAFHVDEHFKPEALKLYENADAFLFDTKAGGRLGGTGKAFEWKILSKVYFKKPVIISGGLYPGNVARAVRFFNPYGVDVSSGVEKTPGIKNLKQVAVFIQNAKKSG